MSKPLTIIEARIDWISCSASNEFGMLALKSLADRQIDESRKLGDRVRPFGSHGYQGYSAGHWKYAAKEGSAMVQIGGEEADVWALTLAHYADHVSRIDYCVTAQDESGQRDYAAEVFNLCDYRKKHHEGDVGAKRTEDTDGGCSAQVGARASAYVGRVYNKHVESKGLYPPGSWRFEVELKRHASEWEQAQLRDDRFRRSKSPAIVAGVFNHWNLTVPFNHKTPIDVQPAPQRVRDADRALEWLRVQVAPTVEWLHSIGRGTEAREALGLGDNKLQEVS